ncbi:tyrosine-type recombinase/integrase [Gordonia sp. NPDC003585]|uniref:tyrosine-type recombinase/integrase n=1 Tax=Gordonia sp. NPDC003585 TaxID=3154275 RepID=UPI0033A2C175
MSRPAKPVRAEVVDGWTRPIERWANASRADGIAESTVRTRLTCVQNLARALQDTAPDPTAVTGMVLRDYVDARTWQPSTYRNNAKAIRAFYRYLHDQGIIDIDPARLLPVAITGSAADQMRARALAAADKPVITGPPPLPVPAEWAAWIEDFRRYCRAGGRTEQSIHTRMSQLRTLARSLDPVTPAEVTLDDLIDYLADRPDWALETRRNVRGSMRAFFAWAYADGRVPQSPAERLPKVKNGHAVPRPASESAYVDALARADDRSRLMLRLSAEIGLRRAEVACVHSRDIIRDDDQLWWILVHGKGNEERMLPLPNSLAAEIRAYLADAGGYLFPGADNGHLSARYVGSWTRRLLPGGVTMHQLRHRFATAAYAQSRDLLTVQQLLGHSSPKTTQRYVAVDGAVMREIVESVQRGTRGRVRAPLGSNAPRVPGVPQAPATIRRAAVPTGLAKPVPSVWCPLIDGFLSYLREDGSPESTVTTRRHQVERFARVIGAVPSELTSDMVNDYLAEQGWTLETRRGHRNAVVALLKWAHRAGLLDRNVGVGVPKVPAFAAVESRPNLDGEVAG